MGGYIIKRILWIIPTLFVIASLFFVLSKNTQKDPIESLLELQGINQFSSPNYYDLYKEEYVKQNFTLPLYYFSFVPAHYPENINKITNPNQKEWVRSLIQEGYNTFNISNYEKLILQIKSLYPDQTYNIKSLTPTQLQKSKYFLLLDEHNRHTLHDIVNSRTAIPIPALHWHGTNNQFHHWLRAFIKGNWGVSYLDGSKVSSKVMAAFKWTATLGILTLLFIVTLGITLSLWVIYKNGFIGKFSEIISLLIYVIPMFWLATLVQVFLTQPEYGLQIFPVYQNDYQIQHNFIQRLGAMFTRYLPAIFCIFITYLAVFIRLFRSNVQKELSLPYVKTALSKGHSRWQLFTKHILPNVMIPVTTLIMGMIPGFLGGSLIIEIIFNIPGMGRLLYNSVQQADWAVTYYMVLLFGCIITLTYLLGDILITWINPKISFNENEADV
jgi:peptide/nickel transport system permease protein